MDLLDKYKDMIQPSPPPQDTTQRPKCPHCGSTNLRVYIGYEAYDVHVINDDGTLGARLRTEYEADDIISTYVECQDCSLCADADLDDNSDVVIP